MAMTDPETPKIVEWINDNVMKERPRRKPQLWIYGPTGIGKSQLFDGLRKYLRIAEIFKIGTDFVGGYDINADLILIDEFRGQFSKQWMNRFLEGGDMMINQKGSVTWKRGNQPVVIISNTSPQSCYKIPDSQCLPPDMEALLTRVLVVHPISDIRIGVFESDPVAPPLPEAYASPPPSSPQYEMPNVPEKEKNDLYCNEILDDHMFDLSNLGSFQDDPFFGEQ